jgi:nitronate monooxygenase
MKEMLARAERFCSRFGLQAPILLAPMAGACPPSLSIAVAKAGGLGACGALMMRPDEIRAWAQDVRAGTNGAFQINTWIPGPAPERDLAHEARVREFLTGWGPEPPEDAGEITLPDFAVQCDAMLSAGPAIVSSIMGVYPPAFVETLKARGVSWFATVSTVAEARVAEAAGADVIVAQGSEAGGHRGAFEAGAAELRQVGLMALLPAVVDAVKAPVVATGGIADARGVAACLVLGASAVQMGTAFLRSPEAKLNPVWAQALARAAPEDTIVTSAFTGRAGRSIANAYALASAAAEAPSPAPYPVQRGLTGAMKTEAQKSGDIERMQAWAGQSAALGRSAPAGEILSAAWEGARALLS